MSEKLEPTDFHEFKLYSAMLERDQAKMDVLRLQVENSQLLFQLAQERAKYQSEELKAVEQKLIALQNRLREKYGIENADDVDWTTGEIKEKAPAATSAGNPGRRSAGSPSAAPTPATPNEG